LDVNGFLELNVTLIALLTGLKHVWSQKNFIKDQELLPIHF
jgi:hypothetical protein